MRATPSRRRIAILLAALSLGLFTAPRAGLGQGLLDDVREDVKRDTPSRESRSRSKPDDPFCDEDDDENGLSELVGTALMFVVASPWGLPIFALEPEGSPALDLSPAPYWESQPGYLTDDIELSQTLAIRITEELGTNFSDLHRNGLRIQLDTSSRFGIDTEWNHWVENLDPGNDHLETGDFNLIYRFAQSERIQFHSGVGMNWLYDDEAELGFNFTYGFDLFPWDPWVFSTTLDAGSLGGTGLVHLRSTAGVMLHRLELFMGVDWQQIGSNNLTGGIAGIRLWF